MKKSLIAFGIIGLMVSCVPQPGTGNQSASDSTSVAAPQSEQIVLSDTTLHADTLSVAETPAPAPQPKKKAAPVLPAWMQGVWNVYENGYDFTVTIEGKQFRIEGHEIMNNSGMSTSLAPYRIVGNTLVRENDNRTILSFDTKKKEVYFDFLRQFLPGTDLQALRMDKVE